MDRRRRRKGAKGKSGVLVAALACTLLFWFGCSSNGKPQETPRLSKDQVPRQGECDCPSSNTVSFAHMVVILFDITGSVQDEIRWVWILEDAANLVRCLPSGTFVVGRFISERSYRDSERFLIDAIPAEPPPPNCVVKNPFDVRQKTRCKKEKERYDVRLHCVDAARARIGATIKSLSSNGAQRTDLWGAVSAAAEIFAHFPDRERTLFVYSDLKDNVNAALFNQPGLRGVRVFVRMVRTDPAEAADRLRRFEQRLIPLGASVSSVSFELPWDVVLRPVTNA